MSHRFSAVLLTVLVTPALAAPAPAATRRAFATSISGAGNLSVWPGAGGQSGLAAADNICRARATAAGLTNASTFRAWISTTGTDAWCHVQGLSGTKTTDPPCNGGPLTGGGPWFSDGNAFTGALDELTGFDGVIYRPVTDDEYGDPIPADDARIWTGTTWDGKAQVWRCLDWASASHDEDGLTGNARATALAWTSDVGYWCDWTGRLLCLEPGASEEPADPWAPAALVFATSKYGKGDLSLWPEAHGETGLDAGDEICRTLAGAAHLPAPESFVAWLSDSLVDARDRITVNAPFRRVDGYHVAVSKADLIDGATANSIHVDETGRYFVTGTSAWTGTMPDGTMAANHCADWTESASGYGRTGQPNYSGNHRWTNASDWGCGGNNRLYCFANVVTLFWDGFDATGDLGRWSTSVP